MDNSRTWKPVIGTAVFILAAFVAVLSLYILHVREPTKFSVPNLIQLSVGFGTGLLAVAAIVTLYFQAVDRIADRAPNLELIPFAVEMDASRPISLEPEDYLWLDEEDLAIEVINVGPGVAKDLWYFVVPRDKSPRKSRWPFATPYKVDKTLVRRYLRVRAESRETSLRIVIRLEPGEDGTKSALEDPPPFVVVVGCSDLDGRIGDVEILGFDREEGVGGLFLLPPAQSEEALWHLMTNVTRSIPRRMGFGLPLRRRGR